MGENLGFKGFNYRGLTICHIFMATCWALSGNMMPPSVFADPLVHFSPFQERSIDGTDNNKTHAEWSAAYTELLRLFIEDYEDGAEEPAGIDRVSAREISQSCLSQSHSILNSKDASDMFWQWGQFLDHDIDLTPGTYPPEWYDIQVPLGDPFFDPFKTGSEIIPMNRSDYNMVNGVRQQINAITSYIDASNVYGSDYARNQELRTLDGTGKLKTSTGGLLPFNINSFPNAPTDHDPSFFLAGDIRANEQVALTAMHTLFVREHNRIASNVKRVHRFWSDEQIYQYARSLVIAEMQAITYNEFLPILLGPNELKPYEGYRPDVDPSIANEFSTLAFRFGHSMLSPTLLRLDSRRQPISAGHLPLRFAFFNPDELINNGGIVPILRGLTAQIAQDIDLHVIDDVRNFMFGPPGSGGFDLSSLNIQRGRDHGLPNYNQMREQLGLAPATSFSDINPDPAIQGKLERVYADVDNMDPWIGCLAEPHMPNALVGETMYLILKDQFERLRDGDRFWYQNYLPKHLIIWAERQTLATIVRNNTEIHHEISNNPFVVPKKN